MEDRVVFELDRDKVYKFIVDHEYDLSSLQSYYDIISKKYDLIIKDNVNVVTIIGEARSIQALIMDGGFQDLVDGNTEKIYDEQHGQVYLGYWDD